MEAWGHIDGQERDLETVRKARALEMEYYRKMNVHEKRPIEKCFDEPRDHPSGWSGLTTIMETDTT